METEFHAFEIDDLGPSIRVQVPSTNEGLSRFNQAFLDPQQRAYVQNIDFHVVLPPISNKRLKKLQSAREAAENDAIFTRALAKFFGRLAKWERRRYGPGITLRMVAASPTDWLVEDMEEDGELVNTHNHRAAPIWHVRDHLRYIRLDEGVLLQSSGAGSTGLPQVACVSEFEFDGGPGGRNFHPDAIAVISSCLVSARRMDWQFRLPTRRQMTARREIRSALGNALLNTAFPALVEFRAKLDDSDPLDEMFEPGILTENGDGDEEEDRLSLGVRRVCQLPTLRRLHLDSLWALSPEAFASPEFQLSSLEYLHIDCAVTTPHGKYLLAGNPDKAMMDDGGFATTTTTDSSTAAFDSDDSDTSDFQPDFEWARQAGEFPGRWFRYTPDPETFVPLARSLAGAVDRMPGLRRMDVHFGGAATDARAPLDMSYFAPGEANRGASQLDGRRSFDEENASRPRWFLLGSRKFDKQWTLPGELGEVLRGKNGLGCVHLATN